MATDVAMRLHIQRALEQAHHALDQLTRNNTTLTAIEHAAFNLIQPSRTAGESSSVAMVAP